MVPPTPMEGVKQGIYGFMNFLASMLRGSSAKKFLPVAGFRSVRDFIRPASVMVFGKQMFIDAKDSLPMSEAYEQDEVAVIRKIIGPGNVVVDIGANIGFYSVAVLSDLVGPKGSIIAFEPDPANFALLKKNVESNRCSNVVLENRAVSDSTGSASLFVTDKIGDRRLSDPGQGAVAHAVATVSLDDYFRGRQQAVHCIKMDIEGAEPLALRGMRNTIQSNPQVKLLTELWPAGLKKAGENPVAYLSELMDIGFSVRVIGTGGMLSDPITSESAELLVADLLTKETEGHESYINLLCQRD